MSRFGWLAGTATLTLATAVAAPLHAEEVPAGQQSLNTDEIVVTATAREQQVKDDPPPSASSRGRIWSGFPIAR